MELGVMAHPKMIKRNVSELKRPTLGFVIYGVIAC